MKILQILQKPQLRGAEIFAAQLAQKLTDNGHQVALLFLFSGEDLLPYKGLKIHLYANPKNRLWDFLAWRRLAKIIQSYQPDIVQANAGDTLKYAALSRLIFAWKASLIFRNANLISGFMDTVIKKGYNQFLLSQVDGVASVSEICKKDFQRTFSWKKPLASLPIGTEILYKSEELPVDISKKLAGSPFLIHIGSFVSEKNHLGLLRITKRVQEAHPNFKLLLVGDGPLRNEIERQLTENCVILGPRKDVSAIFPFAKALLLPSLIEGLPGVILEAMMVRVPVVAYEVGGIPELIQNNQTGFLIPKDQEQQFSQVVLNCILNPKFSKDQILDNAFNLVAQKYTLPIAAKSFQAFYESLLNYSDAYSYS